MSQRRKRKERMIHPGDLAFIVMDCRDTLTASSQFARYEGRFCPLTGRRFRKARAHGSPRFRLLDGTVIWGFECWWTTKSSAQTAFENVGRLEEFYAARRAWMPDLQVLTDSTQV